MGWNRGIFQGSLERQGITTTLPRTAPEQLPLIISENAMIVSVEEIRPELNPMVEYHYGPLWEIEETVAIAKYEVYDINIDSARVNLKTLAAAERYEKEIAGATVTVQDQNVSIYTDRETRNIFLQKYALMGDQEQVNWKFPEGWLILTKQELGQVIGVGAAYIQSCFDWERGISDLLDAATTKEELLAVEIVEPKQTEFEQESEE
jgi:hypothetical protein